MSRSNLIVLAVTLLFLLVSFSVLGQEPQINGQAAIPLEKVLKPDGTLDLGKGYSGSLDPKGWRMVNGKNWEPRFVSEKSATRFSILQESSSVAGDENWDNGFAFPGSGADESVNAVVVNGSDLYIGGNFTQVGGVQANCIAKWDGSNWSALGSGVNGSVYAIAVLRNELYVGGKFTRAGSVVEGANYMAKWDGSSWSSLGTGMSGGYYMGTYVTSIAASESGIYAGGEFTHAGGVEVNRIARWDGNSWSALGEGVMGWDQLVFVKAVAVSGNNVYVGGNGEMNGDGYGFLDKWDGNNWSSLLRIGLDASVNAIAVNGIDLYVGGRLGRLGGYFGVELNNIAKWDGNSWSSLEGGVDGPVNTITVSGNDVYVGGYFTHAGSIEMNGIAKWKLDYGWSPLGNGVTGDSYPYVSAIAMNDSNLFAGGRFTKAGDIETSCITQWNGSSWNSIGGASFLAEGVNGVVFATAVIGDDVYIGGNFSQAGSVKANCIAKWDESGCSALGSGTNGEIDAIAAGGNDVYVGGKFWQAGGMEENHIAKWDGSSWSGVGGGVGGSYSYVSVIAVSGSNVYIGGHFTSAGGIDVNNIAKWDGNSWSSMGSGMDSDVDAIAVSDSDVYVGGHFFQAGGGSANHIAKWNGSIWSPLGNGVSGSVNAIAVIGGDVYAGGWFTQAGEVEAANIAKWDGSTWSPLGSGVNGIVYAIALSGSNLYIGGRFTQAGGQNINHIAKWDGSNWSALGSGVWSFEPIGVKAIAISGRHVYVGGGFTLAGGKSSSYIACWHEPIQNISVDYNFPQAGWYMVSLPVIPADSGVATLFPTALGGSAFGWDPVGGSYIPETKMKPKKGYWLAIPGATTANVTGSPLNNYTEHFPAQGWYMIGSVFGGTDFSSPNDNPDDLVLSPAFGWDPAAEAYIPVTTLNEKEGYWAAIFGECDLTVGTIGGSSKTATMNDMASFYERNGKEPPGPPSIDWKTGKLVDIPKEYNLSQNYPNPFNPETRIRYSITKAGSVNIAIYDLMGRQVRKLESGHQEAGMYEVIWNGKDERGQSLASGIYLCRMQAGGFEEKRKLILMK